MGNSITEIKFGKEYESRQIILSDDRYYGPIIPALKLYNRILHKGDTIQQGYIKPKEVEVLKPLQLGMKVEKPDTIRLRKYQGKIFLTLKNEEEDEQEFLIGTKEFLLLWPMTKGRRIQKKRLIEKYGKWDVELDAFTDRLLLIAEVEVKKLSYLKEVPKLGFDITNDKKWSNKNLAR